jgi:hypothetical protein
MAIDTESSLDGYVLNATSDLPDTRDWIYRAPPIQLKASMDIPAGLEILDQKSEGACTGFGLAAVINYLNKERGKDFRVSARMLYQMARKHDEWPGEDYAGSSCRGAIKGFANMGVCQEQHWRYVDGRPGQLSVQAAKDARANTIGAYYRLGRRVSDFHAALNVAGVLYCSANIHDGWGKSAIKQGSIPYSPIINGGHAFAIIGYNSKGFWVQNSWNKDWGAQGVALWSYEDWHENLVDAWVLSLALSTPQIWHLGTVAETKSDGSRFERSGKTERGEIAGHFVHINDGKFHDAGSYWSDLNDVKNTAELLIDNPSYPHLLFYAHGGLNSPDASAKRIAAMRDVFKDNNIYPYHFMYDTGLLEELKDIIVNRGQRVNTRAAGPSDLWDKLLERLSRPIGRALWREMKFGANNGFNNNRDGVKTLQAFKSVIEQPRVKLHLAGHSTGAILLAHLLDRLVQLMPAVAISSCSLLAPAAHCDQFARSYLPLLHNNKQRARIEDMAVYNLSGKLELDDSVGPYRKSLLYFVSQAFEEKIPAPILGMQRFSDEIAIAGHSNLEFIYSQADATLEPRTTSKSHGGFDNDVATMNNLLFRVLGKAPKRLFKAADLEY